MLKASKKEPAMNVKPRFSIITPSYNRAHYLPETIESILDQSVTDFEYFILDDGSQDNTKEVVSKYLGDERIHYCYHENIGEAETVNRGWQLTKGTYFTQINSDDTVYSTFLESMGNALDNTPNAILAYPDFDFIDAKGNILSTTRGRKWDFRRNLSDFSCEAACPGTMFRRSAFSDLDKLKHKNFLFINDIEMYWNFALRGDFLHVPEILATWRTHPGQISAERYKAIDECEQWFEAFFLKPNLPKDIVKCKATLRKRLYLYYLELLEVSNLSKKEKKAIAKQYNDKLGLPTFDFDCVQIGDNDLIGNKFNGHNLTEYLRKRNINTVHFVCNKQSSSPHTYTINSTNSISFLNDIVKSAAFANADIIHMHLMHNTPFDIAHIPLLSSLKPIVWTIHDPWLLGGHCIHHGDCTKWQQHCFDCNHLDVPFTITSDTSALQFEIKKQALQNSNVVAIVASEWMKNKVLQSPIWQNKTVHCIPFGIDQKLFKPCDVLQSKRKLGLAPQDFIIFTRTQKHFKGIDIIKEAIVKLAERHSFTLITVGENGLLSSLPKNVLLKEYGWINDDQSLVELYQACDLFLMPSERETFGMMAIEAMSCGKVVLALDTPTSALKGVINAPDCGIAVTKEAFADELLRLADAPEELKSRGERSVAYAKAQYNYKRYLDTMIAVYNEAIERFVPTPDAQLVTEQLHKHANQFAPCFPCTPQSFQPRLTALERLRTHYDQHGMHKTLTKIATKAIAKLKHTFVF